MSTEKEKKQNYSSNIKHYHIITIGCQMNKSDSERIAGYLEKLGFSEAAGYQTADLVIITTCGVRQSAEDRVYGLVPRIKRENPRAKIIVTGCLSERADVRERLGKAVDLFLPINQLSSISNEGSKITETIDNSSIGDYLKIKAKYSSDFSAFVPIGNGCDNFCTYCVVPYARGREVYRPAEDIIAEVKDLVDKGYKEITLIAQNVNSYKSQIVTNQNEGRQIKFADLLRLVNDISGDFWIRFATSHPKDMSDELIRAIAECEKICKHIHLPAQAGDNHVLQAMNRNYTREDYLGLIKKIKSITNLPLRRINYKSVQNQLVRRRGGLSTVAITTDIIVGFPGETEAQFDNTVKLFDEVGFDLAYIAQYSPRPGTAAARLADDVPAEEKKRREEVLTEVLRRTAWQNNQAYLGKTVRVLLEKKNRKGEWFGRTGTSKVVKISAEKLKKGEFIDVRIKEAFDFGLNGEIV